MRILVTGLTAKQRGHGKLPLFLLLEGVTLALRSLGHEVTRERKLRVGENLKAEFDAAIVAIAPFGATSAQGQRLSQLTACLDLPHVIAQDDWRVGQVFGMFSAPEKAIKQFWRGGLVEDSEAFQADLEAALPRKALYDKMLSSWCTEIPACLTCAFNWGKHDILKAYHRFGSKLCWDPTPWIRGYYPCSPVPKKRQWALASLSPQDDWADSLGLTWPIKTLYKPEHAGKNGWQVPESEVFRFYEESWGVLSPPYPELNGSGWWRNRFPLSTLARSVIACDPSEISALPQSWFYTDMHAIERMSDAELERLAQRQYDEMWTKWAMTPDESAAQLMHWLDANWQPPWAEV